MEQLDICITKSMNKCQNNPPELEARKVKVF